MIFAAELARVTSTNALHEAVNDHDIERVAVLLKAGHSVDEIDEDRVLGIRIRSYPYPYEYGVTPLHVAALRGDPEMVDYLLAQRADPNHPVASPYSILGRAASMLGGSVDFHGTRVRPEPPSEEMRLRVLASLLAAGADANERKYDGAESPLEMCQRMGLPDAESFFAKHSRANAR
jgi:ankyrin repeat protein